MHVKMLKYLLATFVLSSCQDLVRLKVQFSQTLFIFGREHSVLCDRQRREAA